MDSPRREESVWLRVQLSRHSHDGASPLCTLPVHGARSARQGGCCHRCTVTMVELHVAAADVNTALDGKASTSWQGDARSMSAHLLAWQT